MKTKEIEKNLWSIRGKIHNLVAILQERELAELEQTKLAVLQSLETHHSECLRGLSILTRIDADDEQK